ncbi:uncharacterized protein C8Q71DRAFT_738748 [Rhodofomes roseus]|uniref:Uncharacterized protein n=1 Tax=Rhodofomes roseus TaxID=34475 RepID=A0ABQ8KSQ2_9APHY|nr:uncharacterized protein C8Q71DRAFT_738748 [Rhodofomes roseus]KAH9841777.1 hypothetical protein C8Q71DRAFT_738748 [Rhodofomes roseus]
MSSTRETMHIPGNILGVLCRTSGPVGAFHWIIFLCTDNTNGVMFHVINPDEQDPDRWEFSTGSWDALKSKSCLTIALVGRVVTFDPRDPSRATDTMRQCLQSVPLAVPPEDRGREPRFTCRVWFAAALRRLMSHRAFQLIKTPEEIMESMRNRTTAVQFMETRNISLPLFIQPQPRSAYR